MSFPLALACSHSPGVNQCCFMKATSVHHLCTTCPLAVELDLKGYAIVRSVSQLVIFHHAG